MQIILHVLYCVLVVEKRLNKLLEKEDSCSFIDFSEAGSARCPGDEVLFQQEVQRIYW